MTQLLLVMHVKSYLSIRIDDENKIKHGLGNRLNGSKCQNKIGGAYIYIMWALQYINDNLLKRHIHVVCYALYVKWYP